MVGLGTGTLSCYARPGQEWTFFEIDPAMVDVARNRFTFISQCAPTARIVLGDARLSLARSPSQSLDVLVIDAFSSDSVPMHLLTREALGVYGKAIQSDGILLFHISNRYLDLRPVIAEIAERGGWDSQMLQYVPTAEESVLNSTVSVWVAMSRNGESLDRLLALSGEDSPYWEIVPVTPGFPGWSDDYASILPILKFDAILPGWAK